MKYVVVVLAGVADLPADGQPIRTPLAAARKPALDALASRGRLGAVSPPPGSRSVGSDVALLELFGYDPIRHPLRRGPLEAIGAGIEFGPDDLVLRGNLVSIYNERIHDLTAGRIRSEEARLLLDEIARDVADPGLLFHHVASYRFLLVVSGGASLEIKTAPPHGAIGRPVRELYPQGKDSGRLERVLDRSRRLLDEHPINRVRLDLGENPANAVWLWGPGAMAHIPSVEAVWGMKSAAIAGSPLARGFGECAGFTCVEVAGATGDVDSDFGGKARAAIDALATHDLVFVHVQGAGEASHARDVKLKTATISRIDRELIAPLVAHLDTLPKWRLLVACDHLVATDGEEPASGKAPFVIAGTDVAATRDRPFDEEHAAKADLQIDVKVNLMEFFLGVRPSI
jgi:2,3-bisphosphoglycerate-independent phosphoglycerate mutase